MKICFVCNEYPPSRHGGIGTFVRVLGRELVRRGHQVRVIGIYDRDDRSRDFEVDNGVLVWRLRNEIKLIGWLQARYAMYRKISEWAAAGDIDLVEVPDYGGAAAGWPKMSIPVIARLHGSGTYFASEMGWKIDPIMKSAERWSLRRANSCCSCSSYTAARTTAVVAPGLTVNAILHNAIDSVPEDVGHLKSRWQVIYSGTLTPKKGIISLIDAWPSVQRVCPSAELHICGSDGRTDSGRPVTLYLIATLGQLLGKSVHYHGFVPRERLLRMLRTASVAVFPSFSEAFAIAPIEAMAHNCATIYTVLASGPELIEDGRTGLLVDPRKPGDISNAIIRILQDEALTERLGRQGREHVEKHLSIGVAAPENERFYRDCLIRFRPAIGGNHVKGPSHAYTPGGSS